MKFWTGIISEYFIWSSIHGSLFFRFMVSSGFISRICCLESLFRKFVILIQEFCEFPTPFYYFKRMFGMLRYCFGGLYLDSSKILLGKSLCFWWSVPPVFHILLGISLRFWWTVPPLFFSLLFFVNLVITDKRENVNNKIRKIWNNF